MEEVKPILARGEDYKKLEARVKKLENALCGAELDCKRKATSPSKRVSKRLCKQNQLKFHLNFVSVCSIVKNLTALVEKIADKVPTPPKGNFKKHI